MAGHPAMSVRRLPWTQPPARRLHSSEFFVAREVLRPVLEYPLTLDAVRKAHVVYGETGFCIGDQKLVMSRDKHNHLQNKPKDFQPPLWRVEVMSANVGELYGSMYADVFLDLSLLQQHVERGYRFPGRVFLYQHIHYLPAVYEYRTVDCVLTRLNNPRDCVPNLARDVGDALRASAPLPLLVMPHIGAASAAAADGAGHGCDKCDTPRHVKTPLYPFQLRSLQRMLELETHGYVVSQVSSRYALLAAGEHRVWMSNRDTFEVDGACEKVEVLVRGGFLTNAMGMGKTLTLLALCESAPIRADVEARRPTATLVLCPSHVVSHWVKEIGKHTRATCVAITVKDHMQKTTFGRVMDGSYGYVVVSFSTLTNPCFKTCVDYYSCATNHKTSALLNDFGKQSREEQYAHHFVPHLFSWGRLIVDEFHELGGAGQAATSAFVSSIPAEHKWAVSGTPTVHPGLYRHFVPDFFFHHDPLVLKSMPVYDSVVDLVRSCNVFASEYDVSLPSLRETVLFVDLSTAERAIYDAVRCEGREQQLRVCSYPRLASVLQGTGTEADTVEDMQRIVKAHMSARIVKTEAKKRDLIAQIESLTERHEGSGSVPSSRESQLVREIQAQLDATTKAHTDLVNTMKYVENSQQTECVICLEVLTEPCTLRECGHRLCFGCITRASSLASSTTCPICRTAYTKTDLVRLKAPQTENEMMRKYGSKLYHLLKFLERTSTVKTLIFSQWDELLRDIGKCISECSSGPSSDGTVRNVLYCRGNVMQKQASIDKFSSSPSHNLLLLSTVNSGSGCDLSIASRVVLLDTIDGSGDFISGVERQAISRCHRIGQSQEVEVVRFIAKTTIEESIYDKMRRRAAAS